MFYGVTRKESYNFADGAILPAKYLLGDPGDIVRRDRFLQKRGDKHI